MHTATRLKLALISGVVTVLLLVFPCQGQKRDSHYLATNAALKTLLKQYLKNQNAEDYGPVRYIPVFVDLNDDGVNEIILHVMSQGLCGTGGCPTLILVPTRSSFTVMTRVTLTRPPIRVLDKKTNGWHDLTVWVQGGGIQRGYEADLPFDGESYATNPSLPPAYRLRVETSGRTLISGKATGIPLD